MVVALALLAFVVVRATVQPDGPDLTPVEVSPNPTGQSTADGQGTADGGPGTGDSRVPNPGETVDDDGDTGEFDHTYEPAPNPPSELPSDDDDDDDSDDDDDDD